MANTKINRTPSTSGSSTINTWSFWIKRSEITTAQNIYAAVVNAGNDFGIKFTNTDELEIRYWYSGAYQFRIITNRKFKDVSGWYNIVIIQNAGASTNTDRLQVWINGVRETSFGTTDFPSSGQGAAPINSTSAIQAIGYNGDNSSYFSGSMSHINFVDGTAYNPSYFGSTDSTTGEWKINVSPSVTYGTNGYFILKDGNTITDSSTNSNNFSLGGGTLTKTEDCPANVFCTMNPLNHDYANTDSQLLNGNTFVQPQTNAAYNYSMSTLAIPKGNGKFYAEAKYVVYDNVTSGIGIVDIDYASEIFYENRRIPVSNSNTYITKALMMKHGYTIKAGAAVNTGVTFGNGDIFCIAADMENGAVYFRKNGDAWVSSGDPTSGASRTGAVNISGDSGYANSSNYAFWCGTDNASGLDKFAWNFGNGFFQTTAVSSAGTNASGNGIFEYDVPTGYTALSTKGLNL